MALKDLIGGSIAEPINAVGKIIDNVWTSEGEKLDKEAVLLRLAQQPQMVQAEINKVEAQHRSIFVAGWRPAIGWVSALALFYEYLFRQVFSVFYSFPALDTDNLMELVIALLGLGAYRTVEKISGRAK